MNVRTPARRAFLTTRHTETAQIHCLLYLFEEGRAADFLQTPVGYTLFNSSSIYLKVSLLGPLFCLWIYFEIISTFLALFPSSTTCTPPIFDVLNASVDECPCVWPETLCESLKGLKGLLDGRCFGRHERTVRRLFTSVSFLSHCRFYTIRFLQPLLP